MAGVYAEVFTPILLEQLFPDGSWLNEFTDLDALNKYNMINLSEAGVKPTVVENNNVWPLVPTQRTDKGIQIPLATFDTEPTHVTNVDELETNYAKTTSVLRQHGNSLNEKTLMSAAFNIAPASHTKDTPVLKTTGADRGDGTKALTYKDITDFSVVLDEAEFPQDGRILLLNPRHKADLKNEDIKLYKAMMADGLIDNFKIYTSTVNPRYNATSGAKMPYGSATGAAASLVFVKTAVMRSKGELIAQAENRWADYRGWLIGAQLRFVALPFRQEGIGAIYSANV